MSNLYITTTQNVKLFFTPASIGDRALAYFVDLIIKAAYTITWIIIFETIAQTSINELVESEAGIAFLIIIFIPIVFYTLLSESLMEGKTLGKKLLKIKVVKIDGYQASFIDYFTRWIFILIDMNLGYIPGLTSAIISKHTQRLGDLAAGTAVISEKSKYNISHTILMDIEEKHQPTLSQNQVLLFSDNDVRIIKENYEMAMKQSNQEVITRLSAKILSVLNIQNPFQTDRLLIECLLKDYNFFTGK